MAFKTLALVSLVSVASLSLACGKSHTCPTGEEDFWCGGKDTGLCEPKCGDNNSCPGSDRCDDGVCVSLEQYCVDALTQHSTETDCQQFQGEHCPIDPAVAAGNLDCGKLLDHAQQAYSVDIHASCSGSEAPVTAPTSQMGESNPDTCGIVDGDVANAINECWAAGCQSIFDGAAIDRHKQAAAKSLQDALDLCGSSSQIAPGVTPVTCASAKLPEAACP